MQKNDDAATETLKDSHSGAVLLPDDRAFLDGSGQWIILTTLGADGYPHAAPMGYFRLDHDIYLGCRDNTQKVRNIDRCPKVTLLLSTPRGAEVNRGLMLRGDAEVIREPAQVEPIFRIGAIRRGRPDAPLSPGIAYIRVRPVEAVRWSLAPRRR